MSSSLSKLNIVICVGIPNETILHVQAHSFMTNVHQVIGYHNIIFQRGGSICPVLSSFWNVRPWTKWCRGIRRLMFIILLYKHTMRSKYTKYYYSIIVYIFIIVYMFIIYIYILCIRLYIRYSYCTFVHVSIVCFVLLQNLNRI